MILFCKSGFEINDKHIGILKNVGRPMYIKSSDKGAYLDYTIQRLDKIIENPSIRIKDKAEIMHEVGKRSVHKLLQNPQDRKIVVQTTKTVDHFVDLILSSNEAASNIFSLSSYDAYTYSHSINVSTLNMLIGERMFKNDKGVLKKLGLAGLLHDVGKTLVNQSILFKKGQLTNDEFEEMKKHVEFSQQIIEEHFDDEDLISVGRSHHERWDGKGYPDKLKGTNIHLYARITAVSDVYDAITSKKVYRDAVSAMEALQIMVMDEGHLDPDIFDVLLQVVLRNEELIKTFKMENVVDDSKLTTPFDGEQVNIDKIDNVEIM